MHAERVGGHFQYFPLGQLQLQLQLDEISQILVMQVHFVPLLLTLPPTLPFILSLSLGNKISELLCEFREALE